MRVSESLNEDDNPRKAAALALVGRGFHVFAVQKNEKRPDPLLAPNGHHDATADAETVVGWFDAKPKANIGVACGEAAGLVVLDVDTKNDARGLDSYAALLELSSVITLTAKTPSGGYHLYFKYPSGVALKARHPAYPGIDIKGGGAGGYVVAPPSTLTGGDYAWLDPEVPVAQMPFALQAALEEPAETARETRPHGASPVEELITREGDRHAKLLQMAGVYRGKGLEPDDIEVLLWHIATRYFEPPFSREAAADIREIEQLAYWVGRKEAKEPTELADLTTDALFALSEREQAPAWCDPILPPAGNIMIYGQAGHGKSHLALALAIALARGGELLDWVVPAPLHVLFIDGEMPLQELKARTLGYLHGQPPPSRLRWLAARARDDDLPDLASPAAQALYEALVERTGAQAVFLDNLTCLRETTADAPENSVEAWYPVQRFLRRLNGRSVATVTIHHSAKSGTQRGSSAHTALMDTVLRVAVTDEKLRTPNAAHGVTVSFEKHRRFFGPDALEFRAVATVDADEYARWRREAADPLFEKIVSLAKSGASYRDIMGTIGASKGTVERRVSLAKARGLLLLGTIQ